MPEQVAPRFGFEKLVALIAQYSGDAGPGAPAVTGKAAATAPVNSRTMDRRELLAYLGARLQADESLLLLRGFDRAYRRIVEGL